jgi:cell division inhibitor SulA
MLEKGSLRALRFAASPSPPLHREVGREPTRAPGAPFQHRGTQDVPLAAQALVLLVVARVGLWLMPFATLQRLLRRWARPRGGHAETAERLAWALAAAARRLPSPFRACLPQALAAQALLRRHGAPAELVIGVRQPADGGPVQAHAWVMSGERVVVGWLDDLPTYVRLAAISR